MLVATVSSAYAPGLVRLTIRRLDWTNPLQPEVACDDRPPFDVGCGSVVVGNIESLSICFIRFDNRQVDFGFGNDVLGRVCVCVPVICFRAPSWYLRPGALDISPQG